MEESGYIGALEHDHTELDILIENFRSLSQITLQGPGNDELIEDTRAQWLALEAEVIRHFVREERLLLRPLARKRSDLQVIFRLIEAQHQELSRWFRALGLTLRGEALTFGVAQPEFAESWHAVEGLWQRHTEVEWELFRAIRQNGETALLAEGGHV